MKRRALIVGGSVAGLFLARFLQHSDWDVLVCERNTEALSSRGAGIVVHPELMDLLAEAGAPREAGFGIDIEWRRLIGHHGDVLEQIRLPQTVTSWDRIFRLLRTGLPDGSYRTGKGLVGIEQDETAVTATFADGSTETADVLIGADGIWSTVRRCVAPDAQPTYAGYVAWRGLVNEARLSERTHQACFETFAIELNESGEILGYPVTGENDATAPGHRRYNFVWYRPADPDRSLPRLLTDPTGHRHRLSIPPPMIDPRVVADMRRDAGTELSPLFAEVVNAAEKPFLQPIFDLTVPRMVVGRVALLGDAAFVARPHIGAGVTKAAQDAIGLAAALSADADTRRALERFDRLRQPAGEVIVERGRMLGASLTRRAVAQQSGVAPDLRQDGPTALRQTATLDFLRVATPVGS